MPEKPGKPIKATSTTMVVRILGGNIARTPRYERFASSTWFGGNAVGDEASSRRTNNMMHTVFSHDFCVWKTPKKILPMTCSLGSRRQLTLLSGVHRCRVRRVSRWLISLISTAEEQENRTVLDSRLPHMGKRRWTESGTVLKHTGHGISYLNASSEV